MQHINLLWIFCDQLRFHNLSCNGDPNIATPNLDRLAREGVNFTNAYTSCPVCTPARASVMTGLFANANGVFYLGDLLPPGQRTVAHHFSEAGYRTGYVGKWHLASTQNAIGHNEGIDYWVHPLLRGGFEDWFGFELSNHFWKTAYCTDDSLWPPKVLEGYQTDRLTDLSLQYLEGMVGRDRPWFHVLSVEAPHHGKDRNGKAFVDVDGVSHTRHPAPPEYEARFNPDHLILRDNVPEGFERPARSQQAQYYAQIANLDDNVGRMLEWLDRTGQADTTLVCFFSDHGEMGGSHRRFQKTSMYDEAVRIPVMMRLPGVIPENTQCDDLFSLVDLFPTSAGLCGTRPPRNLQGIDFSRRVVDGHTSGMRDGLLVQWFGNPRYDPNGDPGVEWRGLRTKTHTYRPASNDDHHLFDNSRDPMQLTNRFGDPEFAEIQRALHAMLIGEIRKSGEDLPDFVRACSGSQMR